MYSYSNTPYKKIIKFLTPEQIQTDLSTIFLGLWLNVVISSVIAFFPFGVFLSCIGGFVSTFFLQKKILQKFPDIIREKTKLAKQTFSKYQQYQYLSSVFLVSSISAYISLLVFYINIGEIYEQSWLHLEFFDELFNYSETFRWIYLMINFFFALSSNLLGCWLAFIYKVGICIDVDENIMQEMNLRELQEYLD